jgi:hypothetical protein
MAVAMCTDTDILREWLRSGLTVRICGLDFRLKSSPYLDGAPLCIQKGQGTVVFLEQVPQGHTWLLKTFTPGRRPTDAYLLGVEKCLPGTVACFACTQRRLLTREHVDMRASSYKNAALADWASGGVMMPKVPGTSWASVAEDLRDGAVQMSLSERLRLSLALARIIDLLEAGSCSHRDLSAGNVFVTPDGRVYLIDWDCTYHPSLPFQANTTLGTMGYLAPFLKVTGGTADPALSWRPHADRFALAVLVAEILLVGPDTPAAHEDGTLFAQAQIDEPGNGFVREIIGRLEGLSQPCGRLLERAFGSGTFQECPSPQEWIGALRAMLRRMQTRRESNAQGKGKRRFVRVECTRCGSAFSIARARHDELRQRGKSILCADCLSNQFRELSVVHAQHRLDFPEVSCEYCRKVFSLPRTKLDSLRHQGRPILCPTCLHTQLERWRAEQAEYDRSHPLVDCAICGKGFRLRKESLDQLTSQGKVILCSVCLRQAREKRPPAKDGPLTKKTVDNLKPWHL